MTKEFLDFINTFCEKRKKEIEENDLIVDFDEEREEVFILLWKIPYIFDQKGYKLLEELWNKGILTPNKEKYLCVRDEWGDPIPIHRYLKIKEVEELAKRLKCDPKDVHVHHIDKRKENNCFDNLEVLHKDDHAKKHGFNTWLEFQQYIQEQKTL